LPYTVGRALTKRAASLDLPPARYVRHLLRNDQIAPYHGLADLLDHVPSSKFANVRIPTSLPEYRLSGILMRAAEEKLDVSSYVAALVLRDLAMNGKGFTILSTPA